MVGSGAKRGLHAHPLLDAASLSAWGKESEDSYCLSESKEKKVYLTSNQFLSGSGIDWRQYINTHEIQSEVRSVVNGLLGYAMQEGPTIRTHV